MKQRIQRGIMMKYTIKENLKECLEGIVGITLFMGFAVGTMAGLAKGCEYLGLKNSAPIPIYRRCEDCSLKYQEVMRAYNRAKKQDTLSQPWPNVEQFLNKYHEEGHPFRGF